MTKIMIAIAVTAILLMPATGANNRGSVTMNGYTWEFVGNASEGKGTATILNVEPKTGCIEMPSVFPSQPVSNELGYITYYNLIVQRISEVFAGGPEITSISIPSSVIMIANDAAGYSAFSACSSLENILLPTHLDLKRFPSFHSVTNVELYLGTPSISKSYFADCYNLRSVVIPEGVTNIEACAFANCHRIGKITLPETLKELDADTFISCYSLTNVTFLGDAPVCESGIFENANRDLVVYVPVGSKGWDGNPESTELPKYWPYNTEGGRRIVHIGESVVDEPSVVTTIVQQVAAPYSITNAPADRAIASVTVDGDCAIDEFVLKDGKVYDTMLRIVNTADHDVKLTLPSGYDYETFEGVDPLTIPANSRNLLSITRTDDRTFLVSRERLKTIQ